MSNNISNRSLAKCLRTCWRMVTFLPRTKADAQDLSVYWNTNATVSRPRNPSIRTDVFDIIPCYTGIFRMHVRVQIDFPIDDSIEQLCDKSLQEYQKSICDYRGFGTLVHLCFVDIHLAVSAGYWWGDCAEGVIED